MDFREALSRELLALCRERKMSLGQLAQAAGVPLSTLKNIIAGQSRNPGILTLAALCRGLGVSPAELIARAQALAEAGGISGERPQYNKASAKED